MQNIALPGEDTEVLVTKEAIELERMRVAGHYLDIVVSLVKPCSYPVSIDFTEQWCMYSLARCVSNKAHLPPSFAVYSDNRVYVVFLKANFFATSCRPMVPGASALAQQGALTLNPE